jgi:hypothetical protein
MNKKNLWLLICAAVVCCGIMAVVDGIIQPGYAPKSAIKLTLFLLVPFLVSRLDRELDFARLFRFRRAGVLPAFCLGAVVYGLILGGYFLLKDFIDFSGIVDSLSSGAGVTKENFLFVSSFLPKPIFGITVSLRNLYSPLLTTSCITSIPCLSL